MRRRQIYAERYPSAIVWEVTPEVWEPAPKVAPADTCPDCGKSGLKNVGAHRRFCKG
jgi:hypothetical protein